jgi:biopolymer transport protein ExbB
MPRHLSLRTLALAALLAPLSAQAWWNQDWSSRRLFHVDTSPAGAAVTDRIGPAPILLRLTAGNFRFDAAAPDGSDLRFIAADDKTPLKHHVEKFDPLLGEALVWVGLPDLKPGARTDVWLYYGGKKAVPAEDAKGTFDPDTVLDYHFAEKEGPPQDSTSWANHATGAASIADGLLIGRGLRLTGAGKLALPAGPGLAWAAGAAMTWSAWVKPAAAEASGVIFSRQDGPAALVIGLEGGRPFVALDGPTGPQRAAAEGALAAGSWHHLAVTAGDGIALHVDGVRVGTLEARLPAMTSAAELGAGYASPARKGATEPLDLPGLKGELDELQLSRVERPAGYLRVAAIDQGTDPGKLVTPGPDEESGATGTNYFAILIGAVTLDGWIVIGILAVMFAISWVVMVGKALYLSRVEAANDRFMAQFAALDADLLALTPVGDDARPPDSSIERLYRIGAREVGKRAHRDELGAAALDAIRASLDAGLVRENQRLSSQMVLLTIAISGGPFLGLLGTVVGVMITFAAIAAAGDVNVNAIAPGIAAALVATVAGLAVAIPALFGYNWLLTRVKNVSANMTVFVDEFVTKVAEAHNEPDHRSAHAGLAAAE